MTARCRIESMMNSNHSDFAACSEGSHGPPGSAEGRPREDRFTARIQAFEQRCTSGLAGITNVLHLAAADLFRTMPLIERAAVDELNKAFENPVEHKRPALRQYVRSLQVLRRALEASVALETLPRAMTFQSEETKQDRS
jgi:hypothetical protein